jgi:hypothetical protein
MSSFYIDIIKDISLWKDNLNSDGKKFNQYQQNKRSPLT